MSHDLRGRRGRERGVSTGREEGVATGVAYTFLWEDFFFLPLHSALDRETEKWRPKKKHPEVTRRLISLLFSPPSVVTSPDSSPPDDGRPVPSPPLARRLQTATWSPDDDDGPHPGGGGAVWASTYGASHRLACCLFKQAGLESRLSPTSH